MYIIHIWNVCMRSQYFYVEIHFNVIFLSGGFIHNFSLILDNYWDASALFPCWLLLPAIPLEGQFHASCFLVTRTDRPPTARKAGLAFLRVHPKKKGRHCMFQTDFAAHDAQVPECLKRVPPGWPFFKSVLGVSHLQSDSPKWLFSRQGVANSKACFLLSNLEWWAVQ